MGFSILKYKIEKGVQNTRYKYFNFGMNGMKMIEQNSNTSPQCIQGIDALYKKSDYMIEQSEYIFEKYEFSFKEIACLKSELKDLRPRINDLIINQQERKFMAAHLDIIYKFRDKFVCPEIDSKSDWVSIAGVLAQQRYLLRKGYRIDADQSMQEQIYIAVEKHNITEHEWDSITIITQRSWETLYESELIFEDVLDKLMEHPEAIPQAFEDARTPLIKMLNILIKDEERLYQQYISSTRS
jgi:hypothetical protein